MEHWTKSQIKVTSIYKFILFLQQISWRYKSWLGRTKCRLMVIRTHSSTRYLASKITRAHTEMNYWNDRVTTRITVNNLTKWQYRQISDLKAAFRIFRLGSLWFGAFKCPSAVHPLHASLELCNTFAISIRNFSVCSFWERPPRCSLHQFFQRYRKLFRSVSPPTRAMPSPSCLRVFLTNSSMSRDVEASTNGILWTGDSIWKLDNNTRKTSNNTRKQWCWKTELKEHRNTKKHWYKKTFDSIR